MHRRSKCKVIFAWALSKKSDKKPFAGRHRYSRGPLPLGNDGHERFDGRCPRDAGFPVCSNAGSSLDQRKYRAAETPRMALPSREWKKRSHAKRGGPRIIVGNHQETKNHSRDGIAIRGVPFPTGNAIMNAFPAAAHGTRAVRFAPTRGPASTKENTGPRKPREWPCHPANGRKDLTRSGEDLGSNRNTQRNKKPFAGRHHHSRDGIAIREVPFPTGNAIMDALPVAARGTRAVHCRSQRTMPED